MPRAKKPLNIQLHLYLRDTMFTTDNLTNSKVNTQIPFILTSFIWVYFD